MNNLEIILRKLPSSIKIQLDKLPLETLEHIQEIRITADQPLRLYSENKELIIPLPVENTIPQEMLEDILNSLLNYSIYAYEDELSKGYLTIEGGHRVGICGRVVKDEKNNIKLIKDISSLNIRRSKEVIGAADDIEQQIIDSTDGLQNTIIVSPPKCGKTTLLRDIARILSNKGFRVGICDERSEIAGMYQGKPAFDIGSRTDVLDACYKAEGMMMLIRSMSPDVIITDEIGKREDIDAIESAVYAGVSIITSIHGNSYEDVIKSRLGKLVEDSTFSRLIFLSNIPLIGTVKEVIYV